MKRNNTLLVLIVLLVVGFTVSSLSAEEKSKNEPKEKIPRPEAHTYVVDISEYIDPLNEREVNSILNALEEETGVKLCIVIVPSLEEMEIENTTKEQLAVELLEKWNLSPKTLEGKPWERGILFLLIEEEGKIGFRVETGKGWGTNLDKPASDILQRDMYPLFAKQQYSLGLSKGIKSLDAAIRMQVPMRKIPPKVRTPKEDEFVIEATNFFSMEWNIAITNACRKLYQDYGVPMFVVSVPSIEAISRKGLNFDAVAKRFFLFWDVAPKARQKAFQDHGVLLFLALKDNIIGVRIQGTWRDAKIRNELQDQITEKLKNCVKAGNFPQEILNSIMIIREALKDGKLPKPSQIPAKTATKP